jgi:hypothetical protein
VIPSHLSPLLVTTTLPETKRIACTGNTDQMYKGSTGWRKIPGNICINGVKKDKKVDKKCSQGMLFIIRRLSISDYRQQHNLLPEISSIRL